MKSDVMLSICIGTFNRREILLKNVNSILLYERNDIEIIIVDNASEDGTWEALQLLTDKRVRVFRNSVNKGANFNWLRALFLGQGKYRMILNDRDSIDILKLASFLKFLYENEETWDVIVAMDGVKKVFKPWERTYLLEKESHPSNYIYSDVLLKRVYNELDKEIFEGTKEYDITQYNLPLHFKMAFLKYENWYGYPEQIAVLMLPNEKKKIKQQRFDPIHGDPWYDPEVRVKWLEEQTYICAQIKKYELWRGFYRSGLRILLEIYYDENKRKSSFFWVKLPVFFANEAKKNLIKYEIWNNCKRDLLIETFSGYKLLLWQLSYRFYRKYIVHGSEYWK